CDRLPERPAAHPLAVEPELPAEAVEAPQQGALPTPELGSADDRREPELALPGKRLRIDREPGLPLGAEDVPGVQVLVHEHELALRRRELTQRVDRGVQQLA